MYDNPTPYPSVTDILSPYIETRWFTDGCRERGSTVHTACESHLKGLYMPKLRADWQLYVDSFKRWSDCMVGEIILTEKRLVDNASKYCGKPDAVLILTGCKKPVLVDWKTSQSVQKSWGIQIAAYRKLAEVNGLKTYGGFSVRIKPDGSGCLVDEHTNYNAARNIFVGLLNSYHYFKKS